MSPALAIGDTGKYGRGIYAVKSVHKGSVVMVMGGRIVDIETEILYGEYAAKYNMDISEQHSFCPIEDDDLERMPQLLINHSCEPNVGFRDQLFIVAIRDIASGEEIVYDYSFVMWSSEKSVCHFTMKCLCGTSHCRGVITENDWKIPELQKMYGQYFQPFIQRKFTVLR